MSTDLTDRHLRADARRNRARVLEAADALFAEQGLRAGIEDIAQRAGVGVGTVCRNFATKEELVAEVLAAHADAVLDQARQALAGDDPGAAFEQFMANAIASAARYRALAEELAASGELPVREGLKRELHDALEELVARAQGAGALARRRDGCRRQGPPVGAGAGRGRARGGGLAGLLPPRRPRRPATLRRAPRAARPSLTGRAG